MVLTAHPPSSAVVKEEYCYTAAATTTVIRALLRVNFIFVNLTAN